MHFEDVLYTMGEVTCSCLIEAKLCCSQLKTAGTPLLSRNYAHYAFFLISHAVYLKQFLF